MIRKIVQRSTKFATCCKPVLNAGIIIQFPSCCDEFTTCNGFSWKLVDWKVVFRNNCQSSTGQHTGFGVNRYGIHVSASKISEIVNRVVVNQQFRSPSLWNSRSGCQVTAWLSGYSKVQYVLVNIRFGIHVSAIGIERKNYPPTVKVSWILVGLQVWVSAVQRVKFLQITKWSDSNGCQPIEIQS